MADEVKTENKENKYAKRKRLKKKHKQEYRETAREYKILKKRNKKEAPVGIKVIKGTGKFLLIILLFLLLILIVSICCLFPRYRQYKASEYKILTNIDESSFVHQGNTVIYDKDNNLIGKLGNEEYEYLDISDIPSIIKEGYISVEDKNFKIHNGVDITALARAGIQLIKNKGKITQGGSTITMQVVKNNLLTQERSYQRKILEIMLAQEIEKRFDKGKIMEIYCNTNYYGENCYGISAASKYYFGKDVKDLTVGESAMLIGISNNPGHYNPVADYDMSIKKRNQILKILKDDGVITNKEYRSAKKETPEILARSSDVSADGYELNYAVHCTALEEMKRNGFKFRYIFPSEEEYEDYKEDYDDTYAGYLKKVRSGGYKIYTSFDNEKQMALQDAVTNALSKFTDVQDNGTYAMQGAAVSIDNNTGLVVAIVGGREADGKLNRAYVSARQPGSSIKPLLDYGPAINEGYVTPGSIVEDKPVTYNGYSPKNSGGGYHGALPLREALAKSLNTVAVQLFETVTPKTALSYLDKLGFGSITYSDGNNAAVSIGGFTNGVTLTDMARGYATIENGGRMRTNDCLIKVADSDDKVLYEYDTDDKGKRVYSKATAFMLTDMLQGGIRESYGTAYKNKLGDQYYAGKTGTTNSNKDAWFCGFTPYYTTVVWTGYDSPRRVKGMYGSTYPLTIFTDYMNKIHENLPKKGYKVPKTVRLRNGSDTMDISYDNDDIYGSRPLGWDYYSTEETKEGLTRKEEYEEKTALDNATQAVESYEAFIIDSTEKAEEADTLYYDALDLIDKVTDEDKANDLRNRAGVIHDRLMDEVNNSWAEKIEADKEQSQIDATEKAAEANQKNAEDTVSGVKQQRIDTFNSIINAISSAVIYTTELDTMDANAGAVLGTCGNYPEYSDMCNTYNDAKEHISELKKALEKQQALENGSGTVTP